MRRADANSRPHTRSAVVSTSTPGVLPKGMPAAVHAAISTLSYPTEDCAITRSFGARRSNSASTLTSPLDNSPSASASQSNSIARGTGRRSRHILTSQCGSSRLRATGEMGAATTTLGFSIREKLA